METSICDIEMLWRPLTDDEKNRAYHLICTVEELIYTEGKKHGIYDFDHGAFTSVVAAVVSRTMMTPTDEPPMTQMTQSAMGYSVSGTYLVPGGGIYIKKSEWALLGLRRQKIGVIDLA